MKHKEEDKGDGKENEMEAAVVTLKKGEGRALKAGGAWVYDNEIESVMGSFEDGDIVRVQDFDGYGLGERFYQPPFQNPRADAYEKSQSGNRSGISAKKSQRRLGVQKENRGYRELPPDFRGGGFLPGFVADKFSDVLVIQSLALGIDRYKEEIVEELKAALLEDGIRIRGRL